jgi:hypothetical protein
MDGPCHHPHGSSNTRAHLIPLDSSLWLTAGPNCAGPRLILGGLALGTRHDSDCVTGHFVA